MLAPLTRSVFGLDECAFICIPGGEEGRIGRTFEGCQGRLLGELGGVDPRAGFLDDDVKASRSVVIVCGFQWQYVEGV